MFSCEMEIGNVKSTELFEECDKSLLSFSQEVGSEKIILWSRALGIVISLPHQNVLPISHVEKKWGLFPR